MAQIAHARLEQAAGGADRTLVSTGRCLPRLHTSLSVRLGGSFVAVQRRSKHGLFHSPEPTQFTELYEEACYRIARALLG
jgi:hypothetical protein